MMLQWSSFAYKERKAESTPASVRREEEEEAPVDVGKETAEGPTVTAEAEQ